jgi:hypothetical protein
MLVAIPFLFWFHIRSDHEKEFLLPGYTAATNIKYKAVTRFVQIASLLLFCNVAFDLGFRNSNQYENKLKSIASSFLFTMEMYQRGPCYLRSGTKVAFLGDGSILVGEKLPMGYRFEVQSRKKNNEITKVEGDAHKTNEKK